MLNWLFEIELIIYIKIDLALNNLQRLICHKTPKTNQNKNFINFSMTFLMTSREWIVKTVFSAGKHLYTRLLSGGTQF